MIRFVATALLIVATSVSAAATTIKVDYSVSIRGFPVGKAKLEAEIVDERYSVALSGGVSGLARLVADASTEAEASGRIGEDRPFADAFSYVWVENDETERASVRFNGSGAEEIALDPPRSRPERYVPMTAEAKADSVDVVSAVLWPAATGARPETCERTLPLIDGKRRFDLEAQFVRVESFATRNRSRYYRAVVCSLRYKPIAGHRADKRGEDLLDGTDMEVWLVSTGNGLATPVRFQLTIGVGKVVFEATRFRVN